MKLLLINPKFPESFWSFKWITDTITPNVRTTNPPLGLATLAALSPYDWEIEIVDENVQPIPVDPEADIVGICGMGVQFPRQKELLAFYRNKDTMWSPAVVTRPFVRRNMRQWQTPWSPGKPSISGKNFAQTLRMRNPGIYTSQ